MPTPETWQDPEYLARLRRYSEPPRTDDDEGFVPGRLRTDPRFRAGWNSALWEVHQLLRDGYSVDPGLLMNLAAR